jgi:hypothetical protein
MKTRTNTTSAQQPETQPVLRVHTQLQAGRQCHTYDTSCVSRQGHYNSCGNKIPGAGVACFAANVAAGVPIDQAVCDAC